MYPSVYRFLPVFLLVILLYSSDLSGQSPINSIATTSTTSGMVSYPNLKGAGLRNNLGTLISYWDSTGSSFTVNFSAPAATNTLSLTQFTVGGISTPVIKMPVSCFVKLRRTANTDVGDDRNYFNFWAAYSSIPLTGATSGTFNFTAPEVLNPDDAFLSNNLTSGYDNIFQNSINSPHFGNIERIDFIIPSGVKPINDTDRIESGAIVIDRGAGDPFKIAAITALNAANEPTAFGPMINVNTLQFGTPLLAAGFNYGIMIKDVKYYGHSRPSTNNNQNLRGVFVSLRDLGVAINQQFYGYALFGNDVAEAVSDWTTYPNNSNAASQLDPVNILGLFKSAKSVLSVPVNFEAYKNDKQVLLNFTLYNKYVSDEVIVERSVDGTNFEEIERLNASEVKEYSVTDMYPVEGNNFYRLFFKDKKGAGGYSLVKLVHFPRSEEVKLFPIPASNVLNIVLPENWNNNTVIAELWNQTGQKVQQTILKNGNRAQQLSLGKKQNGFYQLRLINTYTQALVQKNITIMQ